MFEFGDVFQRDRTIFAVRFAFDVVLKGPSAVGHIDFREIAVFVTEQFVQGDVGFALLAKLIVSAVNSTAVSSPSSYGDDS